MQPVTPRTEIVRHIESFLDEVERRGRELDTQECEVLSEILVHLAAGNYDLDLVMYRLELLFIVARTIHGKQRAQSRARSDVTPITEFRTLLELLRL